MLEKIYFCIDCKKELSKEQLNDLEKLDIKKNGFFICSNCINDLMKREVNK